MSGFFAIFSVICSAGLLTTLYTGFTHSELLGLNHLMWGLISVMASIALHCLIFGIFTGAGKDARELLEDINLKSDLALKIKAFRKEVFPPALYCILLLLLGSLMGGAAKTATMVKIHFGLMVVTLLYNFKTFWLEYQAVKTNGLLVKQLNEIAAPVSASLPKTGNKELEILELAKEDLQWGTHVFAFGNFLIFLGANIWLPYLYLRFNVGYFWLPLWPFVVVSLGLILGGFYLRIRYADYRPTVGDQP